MEHVCTLRSTRLALALAGLVLATLAFGATRASAAPESHCARISQALEQRDPASSGGRTDALLRQYDSNGCTDLDRLTASIPDQCPNCTAGADASTRVFPTDPFPLTVTATGPLGATKDSYRGTVSITSSDCSISVVGGSTYTFTAGDAGTHTFSVEITPAWQMGPCTIAVADTSGSPAEATLSPYSEGELCDGLDDNGNNVVDELYPLLRSAAILYYDYSFGSPTPVIGTVRCAQTHQGYAPYVSLL